MADKKPQQVLTVLQNERDLKEIAGLYKHIPHTELQDFHMTLGKVNQSSFPVQSAVKEINRVIPQGKWQAIFPRKMASERCESLIKERKKI